MKKITFGMPSLIELDTLEDNVKLCKRIGLSFIELNMNLPQYQIEKIDISKLIEVQRKEKVYFTFHLPEEIDMASFNKKIRNVYLDMVKEVIEISKIIKSPIINMHMNLGVHFKMPDYRIYLYEKYFNEFYNNVLAFKMFASDWIEDSNIKISVENTGIYKFDFIYKAISELLTSDKFALTWDIGHDYSSGGTDGKFIMDNINRLKHMHIHDAKDKDNHLPLFSGDIDIKDKLDIAEKAGATCVIETKTVKGLEQSVRELEKLGYFYETADKFI
jgi:sugar phosphate isomerase/epimerase